MQKNTSNESRIIAALLVVILLLSGGVYFQLNQKDDNAIAELNVSFENFGDVNEIDIEKNDQAVSLISSESGFKNKESGENYSFEKLKNARVAISALKGISKISESNEDLEKYGFDSDESLLLRYKKDGEVRFEIRVGSIVEEGSFYAQVNGVVYLVRGNREKLLSSF